MDKRQRFMRYVVVREGANSRYLQRFLPAIPNMQWTRHKPFAQRFATAEDADKAAKKAEKYFRRLGSKWTVSYELVANPETEFDDFFFGG